MGGPRPQIKKHPISKGDAKKGPQRLSQQAGNRRGKRARDRAKVRKSRCTNTRPAPDLASSPRNGEIIACRGKKTSDKEGIA